MKYLTANKFSFHSKALPEDTFGVVNLKGSEGISRPYEFEIMLVSNNLEVDFEEVMQNRAKLVFHRPEGGDAVYNGIVAHFEQLHEVDGYAFYRAYLVPKLWWLSVTRHNQIILDKSVPDFIKDVLTDGGLSQQDFEFRLQGTYDPVEYVCQYNESHLNFMSRWLEREGIYYFFEQTENGEKAIFTDTLMAHVDLPQGKKLVYSPPSGLEGMHLTEIIRSFHCRQSLLPSKIFMKDYNYIKPSLDITGDADVDKKGLGTVYYYNNHIKSSEEGKRLARIRAQNLLCRREEYRGEGSVPYMLPGFTFTLEKHYRQTFNSKYLIIDVVHEGDQTGYLMSGIRTGVDETENRIYYHNYFTAIPGNVQFRPEIKTEQPRISGTIIGKIDSAGSGQYADLDEMGRYKIVLPFDLSGRGEGKASAWVRMAQPYAGSNHGMHFPLHKGTEVLLIFIDGDPDRPIIASAVPNPETPSPVNTDNQTMSVINTAGKNRIAIEDKEGSERILLHSPNQQSFIRIGAHNDPLSPAWDNWQYQKPDNTGTATKDGVTVSTGSFYDVECQASNTFVVGESMEVIGGLSSSVTVLGNVDVAVGENFDLTIGDNRDISIGNTTYVYAGRYLEVFGSDKTDVTPESTEISGIKNLIHETKVEVANLKTVVDDDRTEMAGAVCQAIADSTESLATKTQVAGTMSRVLGEVTQAIGSEMKTLGDSIKTAGSETKTTGDAIEIIGSQTVTAGEKVQTLGTKTQLLGETTILATLNSMM